MSVVSAPPRGPSAFFLEPELWGLEWGDLNLLILRELITVLMESKEPTKQSETIRLKKTQSVLPPVTAPGTPEALAGWDWLSVFTVRIYLAALGLSGGTQEFSCGAWAPL